MKRTLLFFMGILPLLLVAQTNSSFLENVTPRVEKTQINTPASDFGLSFVGDELWFSGFTDDEIEKLNQGETDDVFYNIFATPLDANGQIQNKKELKLEDLSAGYHAGPVSFCEKTGELFVTMSNFENPDIKNVVFQKANIPLKIIVLQMSGNGWKPNGELPFNSNSYSVAHPAVSVTGDTLFFASDIQNKGMGGTDIYMAVRKNGKWGEMTNLGAKINTAGDEMFPFFFKGNMLVYASNGKSDSNGGLDIYYSMLSVNDFATPQHLQAVNSPEDDFGLVIHPNEEIGYFASRKPGGEGDDDIYKVIFEGEYELELLVRDKESMDPLSNVKVNFNDNTTLTTNSNGLVFKELNKDTEYTATSEQEGYMNESVTFSTSGKSYGVIKETINIEKVEVQQKFEMKNIFYDFDKWELLPESETELDKLVKVMKDNPSWKVDLGSHTDSRGTDVYNDQLSQKRADSAVNYIISQGISKDRIIATGYGETQLVNECKDGVNCIEEQHQMNRRTEFTILEMD